MLLAQLGKGRKLHHSFPDRAKANGPEAARLAAFRDIREQLLEILPELLKYLPFRIGNPDAYPTYLHILLKSMCR